MERPLHEHPDARFWNWIAKRYARKPVPDQQVYESKLARTNSYLKPADRVLEIGCGSGTTALLHASQVASIKGTDISAGMIRIARDKARSAGVTNVDFEVASIDELAPEGRRYDVILAHSVLHLLADPARALTQLAGMLEPGGRLVSTTACIRDFMPWFGPLAALGRKLGVLPRVNVFTQEALLAWHEAAGLVVEEQWLPAPKSAVYLVARKAE